MSKKTSELALYEAFGVEFGEESNGNVYAECPFCGREDKFAVNVNNGMYRCVVCAEGNDSGGGNPTIFVRKLWEMFDRDSCDYFSLKKDRKILFEETLMEWRVVKSSLNGEWIVPAFTERWEIGNLYRYLYVEGKYRLIPGNGLGHHLFGFCNFRKDFKTTYLTEGPWDGMALYELLARVTRDEDGKLIQTSDRSQSLLADSNVVAVPGANIFRESWKDIFADQRVVLCFDNDHPKNHPKTGKTLAPVGFSAVKRIAKLLGSSRTPPSSIEYLKWSEKGYDENLKSGYDVRDVLHSGV